MDSALVHAAADGDASMVEILLSQGERVDAREQGFTPLLVTAKGRGQQKKNVFFRALPE